MAWWSNRTKPIVLFLFGFSSQLTAQIEVPSIDTYPYASQTLSIDMCQSNTVKRLFSGFVELSQIGQNHFWGHIAYKSSPSNPRVFAERKQKDSQSKSDSMESADDEQSLEDKRLWFVVLLSISILTASLIANLLTRVKWLRRFRELAHNREKVLRVVYHDLSGSLTLIHEYASLRFMDTSAQDNGKMDEVDLAFEKSMSSMHQLLSNLMDWGDSLSGKNRDFADLVDLMEVVEQCIEAQHPLVIYHKVELDVRDEDSRPLMVYSNATQLIIRNLILNAITHSVSNSRIEIVVGSTDNRHFVRITNEITKRDREHLSKVKRAFEKDKRFDPALTSGGMGFELIYAHLEIIGGEILFDLSKDQFVSIEFSIKKTK